MTSLLIPLAGIALPAIIVPASLFAKHQSQKRQERHVERMHAIKAGLPIPSHVPLPGPGTIVAIGGAVPCTAILGALIAGVTIDTDGRDAIAAIAIIWSFAVFIALAALGTALVFGRMLHRAHDRSLAETRRDSAKPAYDPDMFEPSGRAY